MKKVVTWVVGIVVGLAVLVSAGTFVWIHWIEGPPPKRLSLDTPVPSSSAAAASSSPLASLDGAWKVGTGTQVGYRVKENLFGQSTEAVGRTGEVTGGFTLAGTTVSGGSFTVQTASISSDQSQRDSQFRGRIMDVSQYPTSTFTQTGSATLPSVPAQGQKVTVSVEGDLLLHGTTKHITVPLTAEVSGSQLKVLGTIPVHFADYGVDNPSGGPASVGDDGELEVLLVLAHA